MEKSEFDKMMGDAFEDAKESFHLYDAVKNIKKWGAERGITDGDPSRQLNKLTEELGELAEGFNKKVPEQVEDSLGDMFVVMTLFAEQNGLDIVDCIQTAYETIKDREGKTVDGVFVKSEDLEDELMNLRVNRNNERPINPPMPSINAVNKGRVTATIFCNNQTMFDGVKVFKSDLKGLPINQIRFIEVYEENRNKYRLIKVDDIEEIEYSKDEWED